MLRGKFDLLSFLLPIFENRNFILMNNLVRKAVINFIVPLLRVYLKKSQNLSRSFAIRIRHSATRNESYNFFFSDFDLSFVVDNSDLEKVESLSKSYYRIKKVNKFLGELEIYTISEHDRFLLLEEKIKKQYWYLRDLRKIGWIEDGAPNYRTKYHVVKFYRSMKALLGKFEVFSRPKEFSNVNLVSKSVRNWLESQFESNLLSQPLSFTIFSNYLGFFVSQDPDFSSEKRGIYLPHPYGILLLSLVPFTTEKEDIMMGVRTFRKNNKVNSLWRDLTEIEILVLTAVYRGNSEIFSWMPQWIKEIEADITVADT